MLNNVIFILINFYFSHFINNEPNNLKSKSPYIFVVRFIGYFVIFYFFFPAYRGIVGQGGLVYSSFLENHFNIITGLTRILTNSANAILEILQYSTLQKNYHSLKIVNSPGISVNPSCLGWGVMSFWAAFTLANIGSIVFKLKWLLFGIISIMTLNITRIILIVLANHHKWSFISSLDHHLTFNIFSYLFIFLLTGFFIKNLGKYEMLEVNEKAKKYEISGV